MKKKDNTSSMVGLAVNFSEDFERESAKDSVYLYEEQKLLMQEIIADENRLPARIEVIKEIPKEDEVQHNILPF